MKFSVSFKFQQLEEKACYVSKRERKRHFFFPLFITSRSMESIYMLLCSLMAISGAVERLHYMNQPHHINSHDVAVLLMTR